MNIIPSFIRSLWLAALLPVHFCLLRAQSSDNLEYAEISDPPAVFTLRIPALSRDNNTFEMPDKVLYPNQLSETAIKNYSRTMALKYHSDALAIEAYWQAMYDNQYDIGVPAPVLMAIALNESWFKSELFRKTGNPFGIKAGETWNGPTFTLKRNGTTIRYCVYESADEAIVEFGKFIRSRWWYADALACPFDDFKCFIDGLKSDSNEPGYAMDPYWDMKVWRLIKENDLERLCRR